MQYSTNYNMNKPELSEQYRLNHWNDNTDIIDTELKRNADDISSETSRASDAENALRNISDSNFKNALLNFCYPVGSLYWSSKSTDPSTLFGGTWVQIKDRFVLACGDTYTSVGATGGASSVTLSVSNMPSHSHSFTPSGEVTSTFTGTAVNTSGMSGNATGSFASRILSNLNSIVGANNGDVPYGATASGNFSASWESSGGRGGGAAQAIVNNEDKRTVVSLNVAHTHSVTAKGTVSSSFKGYGGTTSPEGSGTSFSILPPYVVKYCWERTA